MKKREQKPRNTIVAGCTSCGKVISAKADEELAERVGRHVSNCGPTRILASRKAVTS